MMNDTKILEEKLAYQEHLLQDLNEVIGEFTVRVLRLERLVKELQDVAVFDTGPQSGKTTPLLRLFKARLFNYD